MNLDLIKTLTTLNKDTLYRILCTFLKDHKYKRIWAKEHFIMAEGSDPICLIAHIDTVFKDTPDKEDFIYDPDKTILWAQGGAGFDDRAGIAAIIELVMRGHRPHIIFTDLEESGGIGATELTKVFPNCPFKKCKALIEIDRAYFNDCVFYSCGNKDFIKFIQNYGFLYNEGTFSDIAIISPVWKIASVNVSAGYLDEHTHCERLNVSWLYETIDKIEKIIKDSHKMKFYKYKPIESVQRFLYYKDKCAVCGMPVNLHVNGVKYKDKNGRYYTLCDDCFIDDMIPI